MLSCCCLINRLFFFRVQPVDSRSPHVFLCHHLHRPIIEKRSCEVVCRCCSFTSPSSSLTFCTPTSPPVCPGLCLAASHNLLHLVFKSIHYLSEWDVPPERVNNVWQRDREAYRMEDSLASISILPVSEGNIEHQHGGCWDSLPQLTASTPLRAAGFSAWSPPVPPFSSISIYYHPKQEHAFLSAAWRKAVSFHVFKYRVLLFSSVRNFRSRVCNGPSLLSDSEKGLSQSHEHVWTCRYL